MSSGMAGVVLVMQVWLECRTLGGWSVMFYWRAWMEQGHMQLPWRAGLTHPTPPRMKLQMGTSSLLPDLSFAHSLLPFPSLQISLARFNMSSARHLLAYYYQMAFPSSWLLILTHKLPPTLSWNEVSFFFKILSFLFFIWLFCFVFILTEVGC